MRAHPTKSVLLTLGVLLSCIAAKGQNLGFQLEGKRKKAVIPVEIVNNLVIVPILLNNLMPLKFILDTGVRTTILTKKEYADMLGLTYSRKYTVYGIGTQKSIDAFVTNNVSLKMPGINGVGHSILALKEDYLKLENYLGVEVHGILGYELFSRFIVQIDYQKELLTLLSPEKFKVKKKSQMLPMIIQDTKPYVNISLGSESENEFAIKMMVDTGASHGLILKPDTHDSIRIPTKNINSIIGRGLGGFLTGKIGRVNYLKMGKYRIDDPLVHFPDTGSYFNTLPYKNAIPRNGSLGGGILRFFTVVFDFAGGKMYLKKTGYHTKQTYNMSGISIEADGEALKEYKIIYLMGKSPGALAGLQVGDRILRINGNSYTDMTLSEINGILSSRAGRRIMLQIERKGKSMQVVLRLADLI